MRGRIQTAVHVWNLFGGLLWANLDIDNNKNIPITVRIGTELDLIVATVPMSFGLASICMLPSRLSFACSARRLIFLLDVLS